MPYQIDLVDDLLLEDKETTFAVVNFNIIVYTIVVLFINIVGSYIYGAR